MGEFFNGWRRKVGVVTLIIACLFTAFWLATLETEFPILDFDLGTDEGNLTIRVQLWFDPPMIDIDYCWKIPYWSIVLPLTLLSALLLLSRPRPKTSNVQSSSVDSSHP